jgi:hypothetical protein
MKLTNGIPNLPIHNISAPTYTNKPVSENHLKMNAFFLKIALSSFFFCLIIQLLFKNQISTLITFSGSASFFLKKCL